MADPRMARLRLLVHGRVQGVFFRHSASEEACGLALTGWVRNLANGDVEIVAEGPLRELKILAAWANQGPRMARVDSVEEEWSEYRGEYRDFSVR